MSEQASHKNVWFTACKLERRFLVKVDPGGELPAALMEFAQQADVCQGVVLSAQGSICDVSFANIRAGSKLPITWPRMPIHRLEGPLNLLSLQGNIFPDEQGNPDCQLVVSAARSNGQVVGGRLLSARVFATCELLFTEYSATGVKRQRSITGGVETLFMGSRDDDTPDDGRQS
ncbi:MAG: DNA-binding protein [Deltaproteobacteria bacterium]|nr:DNA-binding protein [Deltaproteobacteria bacterium]